MKPLWIIPLCLMAACHNDGGSIDYAYQNRNRNPLGNPTNPSNPFKNAVISSNAKTTGILSRTESQISDYITYRLNEWDVYNPKIGANISRMDIADAARWLTDGDKTTAEIEQKFANNLTLMHMAVYVVDNRLNSCFANASVGDAAACFAKWRDNHKAGFAEISDQIYKNTTLINAADAEFIAANDAKITFIVDSDGIINGAKITDNGNDTKYNMWTNFTTDDEYAMLDHMKYTSGGREIGLSYSDFGTYSVTRDKFNTNAGTESTETIIENMPFAGGYASHKTDTANIANNVNFTGRAVGNATDFNHTVDLDGAATLSFDKTTGTSVLGASFDNWYDINVRNTGEIEFSNYTNKNNLVRLTAAADTDDTITDTGASMNVGYYAPTPGATTPTEATGLIQYTQTASGVKMDVAFGAK